MPEGVKKSTTRSNAPVSAELVKNKLLDALKFRYRGSKEQMKTLLSNPTEEVIMDIIQ